MSAATFLAESDAVGVIVFSGVGGAIVAAAIAAIVSIIIQKREQGAVLERSRVERTLHAAQRFIDCMADVFSQPLVDSARDFLEATRDNIAAAEHVGIATESARKLSAEFAANDGRVPGGSEQHKSERMIRECGELQAFAVQGYKELLPEIEDIVTLTELSMKLTSIRSEFRLVASRSLVDMADEIGSLAMNRNGNLRSPKVRARLTHLLDARSLIL